MSNTSILDLVIMADPSSLGLTVMQGLRALDLACLSDSSKHGFDAAF